MMKSQRTGFVLRHLLSLFLVLHVADLLAVLLIHRRNLINSVIRILARFLCELLEHVLQVLLHAHGTGFVV